MRTFTQKLACLLMVLLCCVNVQLKADELTVADGTSTSSYVPAYGLYADTQGAGAQSLYPESMLDDLVGGSISKLTFYLSSPAEAAWTATFTVSLGTTSESSLSSAFIASSDLTEVYTGLLDATGSTLEIELADPFVYSGGNLVVDITVATTGGNWKSAYFYGAAQTAAGRYRNSASGGTAVDVLPKVTFEYDAAGGPTCGKPDVLAANGITATEATLNWSGGDGNYTVEWKRAADTDWVALFTGTTQTSISLQDLIPSTKYMVRVKSVCEKAESGYKSTDFTTECVQDWSISDYGNWTEDFEAYDGAAASATTGGELNACWLTSGTTYPPHVASSGSYGWYPHSGTKALTCYGGHCFVALPHFADVLSTLRINFWARKESSSYGTLKIGYITADDPGDFGTFVPFDVIENNASLREYEYWLDTLPAEADRLVFEWYYSGQYSCGIDDITVSRLPMCWKPKDLHEDMGHATSSSIKIDWTPASPASSSESSWKVQYKKSSDSEWRDTIAGEHPFEILNLEKYTSYDVRVAGYCTPDGLDPEWSDFCDAITAKTAAGVPFAQSFKVSSLPSEWKRYKGLWTEVQSSVPLEEVANGWNTVYYSYANANGVYPDSTYHLYLNITGEECKDWIVSPTIEMEAGYQLSFYLALTQKGSSTPAAATGVGEDQFILAISEDGGATWNAARIWNNDGSFAAINATANGQLIRYGLDAYAGKNILIAFYGESVDGGGDNNLHISGLKIDLVPACENSSTLDVTDVQGTTASLEWDNVSDATWQYFYCEKPEGAFTPSDEQFAEHETNGRTAELSSLQEVTNYTFYLRRKCDESNFSEIKEINFKTIQTPYELSSESSYSNDFQSQNGWLFVNGTMTNAWAYGSAANSNNTKAIYISNDEGDSYAYSNSPSVVYATKVFNVTEAGTYTFSYDWKASGSTSTYSVYDYLRVALVPMSVDPQASSSLPSGLSNTTLPTGWVALDGGSGLYGQEAWTHVSEEYAIDETGYYKMVIVWRNYGSGSSYSDYTGTYPGAIDNIEISRLACPRPSGLNVAEVTDTTATLEWVEESGVTWAYAYALANAEEPELTDYVDIDQTSKLIEGLPYNTAYTFYLRKHCGETYSAYISVPFKTVNPYEKTINDGTSTNSVVPVYGNWVDNKSYSQFIIPADSLEAIQWDTITDLTFHSSTASAPWTGAQFEVYMAEVEGTTISELVDWTSESLTKVMNAGSLSIVDNKMVVALNEPFAYHDGNLLIGIKQTESGTYKDCSWLGVSATGAAMGGYGTSISQRNFLPKMTVAFKPGVAPTCLKPTELDTISDGVTTNSIAINWTPTTAEANWFVQYKKASDEEWTYVAENVTAHPFTISGLEPATIYNIRVAAWCDPADSLEVSNFTDAITIATECAAIEYLSEDFEDTNTLLCWSRITETYTYSSTNYYFPMISNGDGKAASGTNYLYFLSQFAGTPTDQYIILPEINTLEGKRIKFNARKEDASDEDTYAVVGIMTDPTDKATFQYLDSIPMTEATYAPFIVSLNEYIGEGKYIAIAMPASQVDYATLLIDDIVIEDIPSCDEPHNVAAVLTPGNGSVATINWTAGEATSWVVEYSTSSDYAEAVSTPVTEASLALADLTPEQTYYARVKTVCGEELESVWSEISFTPTNAMLLTINDSTATNAFVPIYGYYVDNLTASQFVIPADSIKDMQWGTIKQLTFYSSNGDLSWGDAEFEVYFAPSSAATISATKSWDDMEKAKNAGSLAISGGKMVVTLDAPYQYTGGNLLIGFKQTVTGTFKSCTWYGIEATGASMGGYGSYINQQNFLPKMTIEYVPGEAPSCIKPTELAATLTPGDGSVATLSWTAGAEEEAWTVAYSVNEDFSDAIEVPASATTLALEGLTPETKYYAHVKAVCGAGNESEWSNTVSFTPTNAASMTINRGTITNGLVPVYGYWVDHLTNAQFIIPADSLEDIQWANLKQLTFYSSSASVSWGNAEFEIYMQEVDLQTLSGLQAWDAMEQVKNAGKVAVADNKMVVTLDAPYQYQGGNLVIGFKQTVAGSYSSVSWYGITAASGASVGGYDGSASAQTFAPKMTIDYLPGVAPTCFKPAGLAVHEVTDVTATLKWNDDENHAWKYAVALASAEEPAAENFLPIENDTIVTVAVAQNSDYIFYLRKDCGEDGLSQSISKAFHTKQTPVALPYEDGFEGDNAWVFINGDRINAWVAGEATHNGEESAKAIYVSKDAGATNTYSTSEYAVVYAAKSFIVPAGTYQVQYDWKAQGYNYSSYGYTSPYDYLRVALVPDSIELTASTSVPSGFSPTALPTGWIALDGGQQLNQKSDWQTFTSAETAIAAGTYKVVFIWKNTTSAYSTYNPPAAIDNFSFAPVACPKQTEVAVPDSTITANTVVVHWKTGNAEQDAWQIAYDTLSTNQPDTLPTLTDITANPYLLEELLPEHTYYVYVRANCGGVFSKWSDEKAFTTVSLCQKPDGLNVNASATSASISWNTYGQTGFNLRYSTDNETWTTVNDIENSPYVLGELTENTKYYVQVQAVCGAEDPNAWTSSKIFTTPQLPIALPYSNDFESANDWVLVNGTMTNKWAYGTATNNGGTHALYISNDNGTSNAYTNTVTTVVFAKRLFTFETANYLFQYDWKANGESNYDYLRVALVPDSVELTAGTAMPTGVTYQAMPANWIALDGGSKLNLQSDWQKFTSEAIAVQAGNYNVVFLWTNDYSTGNTPPAAVDNISINKLTCYRPTDVAISEEAAHSAKIDWKAGSEGQEAWQIALDTIAAFNPDTLSELIDVTDTTYVFANLDPETTYYVYVRANCGNEDGVSAWTDRKSFTTTVACPAPTNFNAYLTPGNGNEAGLKWSADAESYTVQYGTDNTFADYEELNVTVDSIALENLTAEATYFARVKANCGIDGESEWSSVISFVPTNKFELLVNDGEKTNGYVPVYGSYVDEGSHSQFIIPAADLAAIQWDTLKALTFYGEFTSATRMTWGDALFEVYVAEVEQTTISALEDLSNLTKVRNAGSLSIEEGKMVVTLDAAYQYEGGNLLIGIEQTELGTWAGVNWYGISAASGASMGGYGSSVNKQSFLPKMLIEYAPGVEPACKAPKNLALDEVTAHTATFSWDAVEGAVWRYVVAQGGEFGPIQLTEENTVTVEGLNELTEYVFYLCRKCGDDEYSNTISIEFMTEAHVASVPFADDFEGANFWQLVNGSMENAWVIGEAAPNGGSRSLYVSNDEGENNAYNGEAQAAVFATMLINLDEDTTYVFQYDWRCAGEYDEEDEVARDYMRVAIVPAIVEIAAGATAPDGLTGETMPTGWVALDGGQALVDEPEWQHQNLEVELGQGQYKIVIAWINDESTANNPAGAIDNFSIDYKDGGATGLDEGILGGDKAIKFIKNDRVYILVNGRIYDATGRLVK